MITFCHITGVASALRARQKNPAQKGELELRLRSWIAAHPREWAIIERQPDIVLMIRHWEELAGLSQDEA